MNSQSRLLSILLLFSADKTVFSVEEIAAAQNITINTAYRDLQKLRELGFVENAGANGFALGGQISILDRNNRLGNPLVLAARPEMQQLRSSTGLTITLTRLYFDSLIGVEQIEGDFELPVGYERGEIVPLFRGCTGKVLIAALAWRPLKRIYEENQQAAADAGLGTTWDAFRTNVRRFGGREALWTEGEIQPENAAVATVIKDRDDLACASLTAILPKSRLPSLDKQQVETALIAAAKAISMRLARA